MSESERNLFSMLARFLYAQCVVLKYDGTRGFAAPRRSRRVKRDISWRGVWYVDMAGLIDCSQASASALYELSESNSRFA